MFSVVREVNLAPQQQVLPLISTYTGFDGYITDVTAHRLPSPYIRHVGVHKNIFGVSKTIFVREFIPTSGTTRNICSEILVFDHTSLSWKPTPVCTIAPTRVHSASITPDDELLAVSTAKGLGGDASTGRNKRTSQSSSVYVYNLANGECVTTFSVPSVSTILFLQTKMAHRRQLLLCADGHKPTIVTISLKMAFLSRRWAFSVNLKKNCLGLYGKALYSLFDTDYLLVLERANGSVIRYDNSSSKGRVISPEALFGHLDLTMFTLYILSYYKWMTKPTQSSKNPATRGATLDCQEAFNPIYRIPIMLEKGLTVLLAQSSDAYSIDTSTLLYFRFNDKQPLVIFTSVFLEGIRVQVFNLLRGEQFILHLNSVQFSQTMNPDANTPFFYYKAFHLKNLRSITYTPFSSGIVIRRVHSLTHSEIIVLQIPMYSRMRVVYSSMQRNVPNNCGEFGAAFRLTSNTLVQTYMIKYEVLLSNYFLFCKLEPKNNARLRSLSFLLAALRLHSTLRLTGFDGLQGNVVTAKVIPPSVVVEYSRLYSFVELTLLFNSLVLASEYSSALPSPVGFPSLSGSSLASIQEATTTDSAHPGSALSLAASIIQGDSKVPYWSLIPATISNDLLTLRSYLNILSRTLSVITESGDENPYFLLTGVSVSKECFDFVSKLILSTFDDLSYPFFQQAGVAESYHTLSFYMKLLHSDKFLQQAYFDRLNTFIEQAECCKTTIENSTTALDQRTRGKQYSLLSGEATYQVSSAAELSSEASRYADPKATITRRTPNIGGSFAEEATESAEQAIPSVVQRMPGKATAAPQKLTLSLSEMSSNKPLVISPSPLQRIQHDLPKKDFTSVGKSHKNYISLNDASALPLEDVSGGAPNAVISFTERTSFHLALPEASNTAGAADGASHQCTDTDMSDSCQKLPKTIAVAASARTVKKGANSSRQLAPTSFCSTNTGATQLPTSRDVPETNDICRDTVSSASGIVDLSHLDCNIDSFLISTSLFECTFEQMQYKASSKVSIRRLLPNGNDTEIRGTMTTSAKESSKRKDADAQAHRTKKSGNVADYLAPVCLNKEVHPPPLDRKSRTILGSIDKVQQGDVSFTNNYIGVAKHQKAVSMSSHKAYTSRMPRNICGFCIPQPHKIDMVNANDNDASYTIDHSFYKPIAGETVHTAVHSDDALSEKADQDPSAARLKPGSEKSTRTQTYSTKSSESHTLQADQTQRSSCIKTTKAFTPQEAPLLDTLLQDMLHEYLDNLPVPSFFHSTGSLAGIAPVDTPVRFVILGACTGVSTSEDTNRPKPPADSPPTTATADATSQGQSSELHNKSSVMIIREQRLRSKDDTVQYDRSNTCILVFDCYFQRVLVLSMNLLEGFEWNHDREVLTSAGSPCEVTEESPDRAGYLTHYLLSTGRIDRALYNAFRQSNIYLVFLGISFYNLHLPVSAHHGILGSLDLWKHVCYSIIASGTLAYESAVSLVVYYILLVCSNRYKRTTPITAQGILWFIIRILVRCTRELPILCNGVESLFTCKTALSTYHYKFSMRPNGILEYMSPAVAHSTSRVNDMAFVFNMYKGAFLNKQAKASLPSKDNHGKSGDANLLDGSMLRQSGSSWAYGASKSFMVEATGLPADRAHDDNCLLNGFLQNPGIWSIAKAFNEYKLPGSVDANQKFSPLGSSESIRGSIKPSLLPHPEEINVIVNDVSSLMQSPGDGQTWCLKSQLTAPPKVHMRGKPIDNFSTDFLASLKGTRLYKKTVGTPSADKHHSLAQPGTLLADNDTMERLTQYYTVVGTNIFLAATNDGVSLSYIRPAALDFTAPYLPNRMCTLYLEALSAHRITNLPESHLPSTESPKTDDAESSSNTAKSYTSNTGNSILHRKVLSQTKSSTLGIGSVSREQYNAKARRPKQTIGNIFSGAYTFFQTELNDPADSAADERTQNMTRASYQDDPIAISEHALTGSPSAIHRQIRINSTAQTALSGSPTSDDQKVPILSPKFLQANLKVNDPLENVNLAAESPSPIDLYNMDSSSSTDSESPDSPVANTKHPSALPPKSDCEAPGYGAIACSGTHVPMHNSYIRKLIMHNVLAFMAQNSKVHDAFHTIQLLSTDTVNCMIDDVLHSLLEAVNTIALVALQKRRYNVGFVLLELLEVLKVPADTCPNELRLLRKLFTDKDSTMHSVDKSIINQVTEFLK